ncbi:unnamed protein product [Meganyctiphanes norvegica]|uniref:Uncharacterized protein n=1 Tax=Meganyctiphanes norvegica TaxID=48144 RepID=A0AAV2RCA4_MEGNR
MPYIELDHRLKPRKLEDINEEKPLPDHKVDDAPAPDKHNFGFGRKDTFMVKKYHIKKRNVQPLIPEIEINKMHNKKKEQRQMKQHFHGTKEDKNEWKEEDEIQVDQLEQVLGPDTEVYYDMDWGLFSAVVACYNNHWVLKTGPDDWWTVVNRRIASALDDHGDIEAVRNFFVDHKGKKKINVDIGPTLSNIDYSWLFSQFSSEIRRNIKMPGFADLMQADFSTTSPQQLIVSQIMLMASVKKYFSFGFCTSCGIPGVEMKGTEEDWEMLIKKFNDLETSLHPVIDHLKLEEWFKSTKIIFANLLKTYKDQPDQEWWSHILSWNQTYGSGAMSWWSGWLPEFLGCENKPEGPNDFPSGLVSVPIHIEDQINFPPVKDDGLLVAGTLGFTVSTSENTDTPVVEPHSAWSLLLPVNSPVTPRLKTSN